MNRHERRFFASKRVQRKAKVMEAEALDLWKRRPRQAGKAWRICPNDVVGEIELTGDDGRS
jgi:hypothetical protein